MGRTAFLLLVPLGLHLVAASAPGPRPAGEWRSYAADSASSKYSPLAQITPDNVEQLEPAWRWRSIDGAFDLQELRKRYPQLQVANDVDTVRISNLKATPLMVGGVLYITTPLYQAAALDAATGKTLWTYDPKSYASGIPPLMLGFNNRGLAYWSDGERERLFWGTGDAYLIALDARTGTPAADFGENGRVDLMEGIPRTQRGRVPINYTVSSAPIVVRDVIVVGSAVSDQPRYKETPPGYVRGFDARTGKLRWTFKTIPGAGEYGSDTWLDGSWQHNGNTNVWTLMSADEELGYVYLPVGTATNDHYGGHRPGNNLFATSLVCVDVTTGRRVWHHQLVHHDLWDYDPPAAPNLLDITVDGKRIKAVAQVTKHGFTFVFNRVTGAPVWPIEERPVPTGDVPGEWYSPTQPFPTKPPPFDRQGITTDDLIEFTPELRAQAQEIAKRYRLGPIFTPPSLIATSPGGTRGTIELPGYTGGANWPGAGVDPETGMLYVSSATSPIVPALIQVPSDRSNLTYSRGQMRPPEGPQGLPLVKPPYGRITAIDLNDGTIVWQMPNGPGSPRIREHPSLKGVQLPPLGQGRDLLLVTKTLLFGGQPGPGSGGQPVLTARNKKTGAVLAEIPLPGSAIGAPMSYMVGGKQYIALTIQGDPPELIALAVP
jgi:quinoprotein glucose dehydrogenase